MSDTKQTQQSEEAQELGRQIYDFFMGQINPELTSENIKLLEKKYKGETKEEAVARAERYKEEFAEYEKKYAQFEAGLLSSVRETKRKAISTAEKEDRENEQHGVVDLESAISNF